MTNSGHGHVYPRPDGVKARCGGPHLCGECAADMVRMLNSKAHDEIIVFANLRDKQVHIDFGADVRWIGLTKERALALAELLRQKVAEL